MLLYSPSTTLLQSISKSILYNCSSSTHLSVLNKPMASPTSTSRIGSIHSVLAATNWPCSSLMHIPMPTLLVECENDASMLHVYLPMLGLLHSVCWGADCVMFPRDWKFWAFRQLVIKCRARSHTVWVVSIIFSHTYYCASKYFTP
jgi:hypothetical protein